MTLKAGVKGLMKGKTYAFRIRCSKTNKDSIGSNAFSNIYDGLRITIPSTVTEIDEMAFDQTPVTIICDEDSYAYTWAQEHNVSFELPVE